ncbi:armadillo-type protein [Mycena crocata]|nr:armadillo-type protein [Mycena crocata]
MSSSSSGEPAPLADSDIAHAIALIQAAYAPAASSSSQLQSQSQSLSQIQDLQSALLAMQRTPAAWGLIVPLLSHADANVQFFGAHTAHAKIARGELAMLPPNQQQQLKDVLIQMAGTPGRSRVVRRKLYGAVVALAVRVVPGRAGGGEGEGENETWVWENWLGEVVSALAGAGAPSAWIHDFLAGAAEDVGAANLLPQAKIQLTESLRAAAPVVLQSIAAVVHEAVASNSTAASNASTGGNASNASLPPALACLTAWLPSGVLPAPDIARLVPALIALLSPPDEDSANEETITAVSTALCELLARPPAAWGAGMMLEPMMRWVGRRWPAFCNAFGGGLNSTTLLRSHTRLLVALAEAGVEWVAASVVDPSHVQGASTTPYTGGYPSESRAQLAQTFLRVMLALTAGDADDDDAPDAGAPLGFWYLLQEALWEFDSRASFGFPGSASYSLGVNGNGGNEEEEDDVDESPATRARAAHARAAFGALVRILRGKVVYPRGALSGWSRDRLERFAVYRRDVGDTLVNAYYILREDLLAFYVGDVAGRLERGVGEWEEIEASLHCLRAVHEAIDPDADAEEPPLARLFGAAVWGRMPGGPLAQTGWENTQGKARLRRTALAVVDTYASYFTTRPSDALLPPLQYVIGALADGDSGICLQAALALRSLCDANRRALASRIGAFAEVHAGLGGVPDSEKGKVLQSIASVIQALPPAEAVAPVEAMVGPILQRLGEALGAAGDHPEPARLAAILQLEILAGVAKGLTRTQDPLAFDEEDSGGAEADAVRAAREDPRTGAMRGALFDAIARVAELWSADSEVGQALSELFRAITALPSDVTLLSLPAQPLLGVVCRAAERRLNAVWLALATILIAQLNPPPLFLTIKAEPNEEAEAAVRAAVGEIVAAALGALGAPGGMVENPDIVQEFFACMDRVAQDFTGAFCALPDGAFDALMQCAISALALQERYSLVAACTFLGTLIHRTALYAPLSPELLQQLQAHMIRVHGRALMRAVLCGFAGAAPRSVTSNLLELMAALVARWDERAGGARAWVADVVFAEDFFPSRAGQEAKERFVKTVVSSRSVKKTKEAANQFTIVAWGLEGSTFGYSSVSSV